MGSLREITARKPTTKVTIHNRLDLIVLIIVILLHNYLVINYLAGKSPRTLRLCARHEWVWGIQSRIRQLPDKLKTRTRTVKWLTGVSATGV